MKNSTKKSSILPTREDTGNWGQPSMCGGSQRILSQNTSQEKQGISEFDRTALGRHTWSSESSTMTANLTTKKSPSLTMNKASTYNQNMSQVNIQPVSTRPIMCNTHFVNNAPKPMPTYYAVHGRDYVNMSPTQVYPFAPKMETRKHEHFGNRTMTQWSPQVPRPERVNMIPVSSTAMAPCRIFKQSSKVKARQDRTGMSLSTTVLPTKLRTMDPKIDPIWHVGMQESNSEPHSIVTNVNSPVIFSCGSTPFSSYVSPSYYLNSPSHVGTPLLLCTPPAYFSPSQMNNRFPSVATSLDIPSSFELYNKPSILTYPSHVSCNISHAPEPSFLKSYARNEQQIKRPDPKSMMVQEAASDSNSGLSPEDIPSDQAGKKEIVKEILEDDKDIWNGSCAYKEYKKDGGSNLFIT